MDDLISIQAAIDAAIDAADDWDGGYSKERERFIREALEELPSVQPRNGLWIDIKHTFMTKCSVCDWINNDDSGYNFCPNCGADMREGEQDE